MNTKNSQRSDEDGSTSEGIDENTNDAPDDVAEGNGDPVGVDPADPMPTPDATPDATSSWGEDLSSEPAPYVHGIKYVGMADVRNLSASDLQAMGVKEPKGDLSWNVENGRFVPMSDIDEDTQKILLRSADFVVV